MRRRLIGPALLSVFALWAGVFAPPAAAAPDVTPPVLSAISLTSPAQVYEGDTVSLTWSVSDESGMMLVLVRLTDQVGKEHEVRARDGASSGSVLVDMSWATGGVYVNRVTVFDTAQNFADYQRGGRVQNFPGGDARHSLNLEALTFRVGPNLATPQVALTYTPPAVVNAGANEYTTPYRHIAYQVTDADDLASSLRLSCTLDQAAVPCAPAGSSSSGGAAANIIPLVDLADGPHTFSVVVVDPAGHTSPTAFYSWLLDRTVPRVTMTQPSAPVTLATTVPVAWTGDDPTATYELRWRRAARGSGGFGTWTGPTDWAALTTTQVPSPALEPGSSYCFAIRAADAAGNVSDWMPYYAPLVKLPSTGCVTQALDDRALTASGGWTRAKDRKAYAGTSTTTQREGATLRLTKVKASRLAVVATTCRSCGKVSVYVGKSLVGKVDLKTPKTKYRQILALRGTRLWSGPVTVRTLTTRRVTIDGLATSRG